MTIAPTGESPRAELSLHAWQWTAAGLLTFGAAVALLLTGAVRGLEWPLGAGLVCLLAAHVAGWVRESGAGAAADPDAVGSGGRALVVVVATLIGAGVGAAAWAMLGRTGEEAASDALLDGAMLGATVFGGGALLFVTLSMLRRAVTGIFDGPAAPPVRGPRLSVTRGVSVQSAASLAAGGVSAGLGAAAFVETSPTLRWLAGAAFVVALLFAWRALRASRVEGAPERLG